MAVTKVTRRLKIPTSAYHPSDPVTKGRINLRCIQAPYLQPQDITLTAVFLRKKMNLRNLNGFTPAPDLLHDEQDGNMKPPELLR